MLNDSELNEAFTKTLSGLVKLIIKEKGILLISAVLSFKFILFPACSINTSTTRGCVSIISFPPPP